MLPAQLLNVADAQSGHAGEQRCLTEYLMLAWGSGELLYFFKRDKLNLGVLPFDFFEEVVDVLPQEFLLIRLFEQSAEC